MKKTVFLFLVGIFIIAVTAAFIWFLFLRQDQVPTPTASWVQPETEVISTTANAHKETITLVATGDCLMHNTQIAAGLQKNNTYSFTSFFTPVRELLAAGDYTSTTLETPLAGASQGYTGYPLFNSPDAMSAALKESGFDLVVTAHNHTLDQGVNGALRTLEVLRKAGLDTVGTYTSKEEKQQSWIKEIRGVKVGYLSYTYGTNGIALPDKHQYLFNYIQKDKILQDISALRPKVDILLLVLHWGIEYSTTPGKEQKELANTFLAAGADGILGSHPHVIQPMEIKEFGQKKKFVLYSMGNFISHQKGLERNSGIILNIKYTKDFNQGTVVLEEVSYIPTYSYHYFIQKKNAFHVVPIEQTMQRLENSQPVPGLSKNDLGTLKKALQATRKTLGPAYYREKTAH